MRPDGLLRIAGTLGVACLLVTRPVMASAQHTFELSASHGPSISDAIHRASPGDRIVLARGIYKETTIVVDRTLTITGEAGAIIDGSRATHILRVEADDVTIRGITFRNVSPSHVEDRAAIRVGEVRRCRIEDNHIENAFFGIYLAGTVGCHVARNELRGMAKTEDGAGNGIHLWTARDVDITDNHIVGHRDGIYLEFVHDSRITGNSSERNLRYGMHFMYSDDCRYERNLFRANASGVAVMYTKRVVMIDNTFESNWGSAAYGLLLKEIYDAHLEGNHFVRNTTALVADGATRLDAEHNVFADNGWAVRLMASTQDATFASNSFIGNTFDVATNSRQTSNHFRDNYWDEYRGYDLNRDGVGDVPHRPVRLFSLLVERNEPTLILLRSPVVKVLDAAERILPSLTPEMLADPTPRMRRPQ
jgi:nitrous oxidase accessory protein